LTREAEPYLALALDGRTVQQFLTGPVLRDGVVPAPADVQPEEHGDLVMPVDHEHLRPLPAPSQRLT
jgi:hypothetical protein